MGKRVIFSANAMFEFLNSNIVGVALDFDDDSYKAKDRVLLFRNTLMTREMVILE